MPLQDGHGGHCQRGIRVGPLVGPVTHRTHLGSIDRLDVRGGNEIGGVAREVIILTRPAQIDGAPGLPGGGFLPVQQQQMSGTIWIDRHAIFGYKNKTRLRTAPSRGKRTCVITC